MTVAAGPQIGLPVEIAFLAQYGVPPSALTEVARVAERIGVDPSRQVIVSGLISETGFYRALAETLGLRFLQSPPPLRAGGDIAATLRQGMAQIRDDTRGPFSFVLAPTGAALRRLLVSGLHDRPDVAIVTPAALAISLRRANARQVASSAAWLDEEGLARTSARTGSSRHQKTIAFLLAGLVPALAVLEPVATLTALGLLLSPLFLGLLVLRLGAVLERPAPDLWREHGWQIDDGRLPVYTVAVPLLREEKVLDKILAAMAALDYPPAKLDIRLLIEEGDTSLRAAVARRELPPQIEVVIVPAGSPLTKPRALNVALAEARGELFTIYDAEDVPEPRQLRLAAARFLRAGPDLVCLQARLVIDNPEDGPLQGLFALEYAGLFDVLNPGLLRGQLPILLGGTSNHFRTEALRAVGGWDAWNVTEDADIGVRLSRIGGRIADLPSWTLEEAPPTLPIWLKQRRRWLKGYLQTAISHLHHPMGVLREAGFAGSATVVTLALGTLLSALCYPFVVIALLSGWLWTAFAASGEPLSSLGTAIAWTLALGGVFGMLLPPALGAWRRGATKLWRGLPLLPFYYCLVSLAAWLALAEYLTNRFGWNKTAHGFARSSRYGASLPAVAAGGDLTGSAATPSPHRPESARC